jgi:hypothetical protein
MLPKFENRLRLLLLLMMACVLMGRQDQKASVNLFIFKHQALFLVLNRCFCSFDVNLGSGNIV